MHTKFHSPCLYKFWKTGVSSFPRDYPDTSAGRSFWQAYHNKMHAEDAKRPTAKQIAHNNLAGLLQAASHNSTDPVAAGIFLKSSPCMEFTGEKFESVLIVRGESYLKDFRPPPYEDLTSASIEQTRLEIASRAQADSTYFWTSPYIPKLPALPPLMFLQVLLVPVSKGLVLDLAEIVCPTEADIELFCAHKLNTQARRKGHGEVEESLQPGAAHSGFYKHAAAHSAAETARINKKQDVLDLSQSWLGVKLTEKVKFAAAPLPVSSSESEQNVDGDDAAAAGAKKKGAAKKKNQPKKVSADYDIGAQEGRKVIGTVTTGQKEHLNNTHFALGLCNVNALNNLFRRSYGRYLHPQVHILVLFRNSRSDWLRPATLQII